MSFARNIALAGTFAFALLASSAAPADSARPVAAVAAATTSAVPQTFSAQSVLAVRLTPADMTSVQGNGPWSWLKRTVKKAVTWVQRNWGTLERIYEILRDIWELINSGDDGQPDTVTTVNYQEDVTADEIYDEAGNLISTNESSTGTYYVNTVVSGGGGGGSSCIDMSQPGCEAMY